MTDSLVGNPDGPGMRPIFAELIADGMRTAARIRAMKKRLIGSGTADMRSTTTAASE